MWKVVYNTFQKNTQINNLFKTHIKTNFEIV
jgi:hypothetical protein